MPTTNIQVRVDQALKTEAEELFSDLGLDIPTAIRLFLKQSLINNGLPFAVERDPFYSPRNLAALRKSIAQLEAGHTITKTLEELEGLAD
jgi:DNA-damage-inducible protein J